MAVSLLASLTAAATIPANSSGASIIQQIAPASASCAAGNTECRTAKQAAPYIFQSFAKYGLDSANQKAAVISLMAYESDNFVYKTNQYPGRPGQGTANMQMASFNLMYAKSIKATSGAVAEVSSVDGLSDTELDYIIGLVTVDKYNFGSGAWFLKTQCGNDVMSQLASDVDQGFQAYMSCVGVEASSDRLEYLDRAKTAFGI
ncbi:hypothetical protein GMORB2_1495 [Geosmithia morbida]|uniref:Uncharacterized protein n=1 Tax=Geosmithia morbida TaxID=1094350 RepID=A0A9P4Z2J2_9HYPO|nr:uncharacterized protein GMORB2_1495 [Geosmithia morbida]KAF4126249.1 hypothetical protein GMORB2_1495 [Geosmithia morbida]